MATQLTLIKSLDKDNILNIDTERFFRDAEDFFYFFERSDKAVKKLYSALELTPDHVKSIKLLGDIYFSSGKMQKAFDYYSQAAALKPDSVLILASLASVCEALHNFKTALDFINLAFENYKSKDYRIHAQMCDLKFTLLVKMKRYKEAKNFLEKVKKVLPFEEAQIIAAAGHTESLKKKINLKERMENLNIKVV